MQKELKRKAAIRTMLDIGKIIVGVIKFLAILTIVLFSICSYIWIPLWIMDTFKLLEQCSDLDILIAYGVEFLIFVLIGICYDGIRYLYKKNLYDLEEEVIFHIELDHMQEFGNRKEISK